MTGTTAPSPTGAPGPAKDPAADVPRTPSGGAATGGALWWVRARGFLIATGVLLVGAVTLAALQSEERHGYLDPRSADPYGSRAVAELLGERGVTTRVVTTAAEAAAAAGPDTTLLVTDPDVLGDTPRGTLRSAMDLSGGRTVLLGAGGRSLTDLAPGVRTASYAGQENLDPGCSLPAAVSAGRAATGDSLRYTTDLPGAVACYPSDGHPTLLVLPGTTKGGDTVLLGSESILLNRELAEQGNASLALQLLGSRTELVWYLPGLADQSGETEPSAEEKSLFDLIPAGWGWALLQLFVAAVLAALWRARRLGPLVTEKLPVAVRASEATEGRARLYRLSGARDRAATVLRAASRERLASLVGVPAVQAHEPGSLVPAVSARLSADGAQDLTALLFGTTPADDAALVALADHLDALEREVRTS
ncbi:DUF4350 domain-containing protein [Streptomyces sp. NBC_01426]|uniref:DUF4350 domain-containing protein n=1 Tax=Streptomyces sp. NBC_01426 TaxID=2975866 RepID=UPI002E354AE6|nr:DUF4350 domain-containing protein [Streptomyces sp. NBC_01426]